MKKVIGIDLGGTKINGGVVDETGNILEKLTIKTDGKNGKDGVLKDIKYLIRELMMEEEIEAIGLGSPGFINTKEGKVLSVGGNILGWPGTNIREELSRDFAPIPIIIENDANVAAICEQWLGVGKDLESFIMITLGTGVGGGIWTSKESIWNGSHFQGAELGHSILYPNGRSCNCGQRGCVEKYISGSGIENNYFEKAKKRLKGVDIFLQSRNDPVCRKVVDEFTTDLSVFLISIKNIFDPDGIIIGGGVINSKDFWWDEAVEKFNNNCNNTGGVKILPAKYLNDSGLIGAAKLAFDYMGT